MSISTILNIQGPPLSLKSPNFRNQRQKVVVCCCPWSGSDIDKTKDNTISISLENVKTNKCPTSVNHNLPLSPSKNTTISISNKNPAPFFPLNFISYILSLGPLSTIININPKLPPTPSIPYLISLSHYLIRSRPHHYFLTDLTNKYGPLVYLKVGEMSAVIVSSADIAKEVLNTLDPACAGRPKVQASDVMWFHDQDVFFHQYDEYWKNMRNLLVSELLGAKNVRSYEHVREDEGTALVESIRKSCGNERRHVAFNLSDKIYLYTFTVLCRAILGDVSNLDVAGAIAPVRNALHLLGEISGVDVFPSVKVLKLFSWHRMKLMKTRWEMDKFLEEILDDQRRKAREGDGDGDSSGGELLIDVMMRLKENGELTDEGIKSLLLDLLAAGTDNTPSTANWAMAEMMKNPDVMAKAQHEIREAFKGRKTIQEVEIRNLKYLKFVIMETLRLHPPLSTIPRACREEVNINGYDIPTNTYVILNVWAMGRDPKYWKNPESFEPERFEENQASFYGAHFEFLPFGSGKRMCPGIAFSLAKLEFLLATMLYHFDWELPHGMSSDDIDMTDVGGIAVTRKTDLHLIAKPYDPCT